MSASAIRIPFLWRQTWTRWRRTQSGCPTTMSTPPAPPQGRRWWQVRLFPVLLNATKEYNRNCTSDVVFPWNSGSPEVELRFCPGGSVMARQKTNSDVWIHHATCMQVSGVFHKNRDLWAILGLSQDGACTTLFENFHENSLKQDLWNDTTVKCQPASFLIGLYL